MGAISSTIALGIISNFATDVLKWASGARTAPLEEAITSTASSFPELEGIEDRLQEWLRSPDVSSLVTSFVEGNTGTADLPIGGLVAAFIEQAGFYLPEHSQATAEKILNTFLVKVRAAYLVQSPLGILHVANRQEVLLDGVQEGFSEVKNSIETAGGLRPALQTHFERAMSLLDARDFRAAKALFESLLAELERSPIRDRNIERRSYASLGHIAAAMGENDRAVVQYRKAVELDDEPVRAAVNAAVADLIEQKPGEALRRLESAGDAQTAGIPR